jgi:cytoskeletal protein CcmA (bactofilin family)
MDSCWILFLILVTALLVLCLYGKRAVEKFTNYFEGGEISSQLAGVELSPAIQQQKLDFQDIKASLNQYVKKDEPTNVGTKSLNAEETVAKEVNIEGRADFQKGLEVAGTTTVEGGAIPNDIRFIGGDLHDSGVSSSDGNVRVYVEDLPGNDIGMYFKTAKGNADVFVARKNGERFLIKAGEVGAEGIRIADKFEFRGDQDGWLNIDGGNVGTGKLTVGGAANVEGAVVTQGFVVDGAVRGNGDLVADSVKAEKEICVGETCLLEDIWAHLQVPRPGPVGPQGPQGRQGAGGETGSTGIHGETGPIGPLGFEGPRGPQGPKGETGPQGPKGPKGPLGPIGPIGPIGDNGPQGPQGEQGQGAVGIKTIVNKGVEWHVELMNGNIIKVPTNSLFGTTIKNMTVNGNVLTYTKHDDTTTPIVFPQITIPPSARYQGFVGAVGPKGKPGVQGAEGPLGARGREGTRVEWVRVAPNSRLVITEDGQQREVMFPNPLTTKYATRLSMENDNMIATWSDGSKQLVTHFPR